MHLEIKLHLKDLISGEDIFGLQGMVAITVLAPIRAADTIQKLLFEPLG